MVDGVVDIPLPGRSLDSAAEAGRRGPAVPFPRRTGKPAGRGGRPLGRRRADQRLQPAGVLRPERHGQVAPRPRVWRRRGRPATAASGSSARRRSTSPANWPTPSRRQAVDEFRDKHRGAALLVVEDLGMLATRKSGKLSAQEELIHTLDALVAEDRWVVVTASAAPAELPGILPALQSRLTAGLTIPLGAARRRGPAGHSRTIGRRAQHPAARAGRPRAGRRARRHGAGVGRRAAAIGHVRPICETMPLDVETARRFVADRSGARAADAARDCLGHGPAFFAATDRLAESGAAPGVGRRPRRGRLPRPAADRREPATDRRLLWRPRPHDRDAQLPQDGRTDRQAIRPSARPSNSCRRHCGKSDDRRVDSRCRRQANHEHRSSRPKINRQPSTSPATVDQQSTNRFSTRFHEVQSNLNPVATRRCADSLPQPSTVGPAILILLLFKKIIRKKGTNDP